MQEEINKHEHRDIHDKGSAGVNDRNDRRTFRNYKVWFVVMIVYTMVFSYIGYIAFWPMAFNDPEQTVEKYFKIIDKYGNRVDVVLYEDILRATINDLINEAEAEADEMQRLASQSFNIVLGAFLAFLSATVTTIFQRNKD
ncbi:hypothetical protein ABW636_04855 [Aquimarina sp. 2201CG1-2-11]|uniref:hypothetical protein n=1 Tax=Aquimarina discodermiae TaxID=3231043 RepID=UPI003461EB04